MRKHKFTEWRGSANASVYYCDRCSECISDKPGLNNDAVNATVARCAYFGWEPDCDKRIMKDIHDEVRYV